MAINVDTSDAIKRCSDCGRFLSVKSFGRRKDTKDKLKYICKKCENVNYLINQDEIKKRSKLRHENNREYINENKKQYYLDNLDHFKHKQKQYREENKDRVKVWRQEENDSLAPYHLYKDKLTVDELPRLHSNGFHLEVKCKYCGEYFIPQRKYVRQRIYALNDQMTGECNIYCSDNCKHSCPIFDQHLWPKNYKPATSREVQPQLRQLVFERDNYICQKCNKHKDELEVGLHCHHKYPLNENPIESADIDTCITYCAECHKEIHMNVAGCRYGEMRC